MKIFNFKKNKNIVKILLFTFCFFIISNSALAGSWTSIGTKITKSTVSGAVGSDILIAYSGWMVTPPGAQKWAQALVDTILKEKGVGIIYAVAGPSSSNYSNKEIGNTKLVADIIANYKDGSRIFIVDHSSGIFPAIEFLNKINSNTTIGKPITIFNIDGDVGVGSAGSSVLAFIYGVIGSNNTELSFNSANVDGIKIIVPVITDGCISTSLPMCIHMRLVNKDYIHQSATNIIGYSAVIAGYNSISSSNIENSYLKDIQPNLSSTNTETPIPSTPGLKAITQSATNISFNSAKLNGVANINGDTNADVKFQYNKIGFDNLTSDISSQNVSETITGSLNKNVSTVLSGLEPSTTYYFRLKIVGGDGTETIGDMMTFTTMSVTALPNSTTNTNAQSGTITTPINYPTNTGLLIPCGTKANPAPCSWNKLITLINNVINFVLFTLALPIAAIMFAYAGIMLLTSGGDTSKMKKAKELFVGVAIGLVVAAGAWIIVHTILSILGYSGSWIGF
jgi:hypothetical protein